MILIATPTPNTLQAPMVKCLTELMRQSPEATIFEPYETTYIGVARTALAGLALQRGATHLLFLDSDMTFPADLLHSFIIRDVDVVAANYRRRRALHDFTAGGLRNEIVSSVGATGMEQVRTIGFGAVLIRTTVFRQIPQPWFSNPGGHTEFEDVAFCCNCAAAGIPIYVDHDVSQNVAHLTTFPLHTTFTP